MSRVGINPVKIVSGVDVKLDGLSIEVKGPKGTLTETLPEGIDVKIEESDIIFKPANDNKKEQRKLAALWGLCRALVANMIEGVTNGYTKKLEINGVGYKAQVQGKTLKLSLGYSHDIDFAIPEGIDIKAVKPTELEISGINKQQVGQVAAKIRSFRTPEPYKGKGVKYDNEYIVRKEGKKK